MIVLSFFFFVCVWGGGGGERGVHYSRYCTSITRTNLEIVFDVTGSFSVVITAFKTKCRDIYIALIFRLCLQAIFHHHLQGQATGVMGLEVTHHHT